ncbi:metallophosphoesterase [Halalkalibacillus halophilus]|uniref:metallophosphoesterase n=1 Tax=Halalkalibacillus halophilus TaxID=392827 RepID=UPI000421B67C|nr:metallophosphoesterase [Halalkalibacillus halophilus]
MTEKISRRSFLKKATVGTLGAVGLTYGGYYYANEIEPHWIKLTHTNIESHRIPESFDQFKIIQITDTHIGFQYQTEELQQLRHMIEKEEPDLIVFTGDLTDDPSTVSDGKYQRIINELSQLDAPEGKFWIYGNHDHGGYGTEVIRDVMATSGFELLQNETVTISRNEESINIAGLDDILLGSPNVNNLITDQQQDMFNILLCHEPDYADSVIDYPFDIQLSGHSHGGQVQIPFYGYVVTPALGEKYVEGKHVIGNRPLQLFVSRGVGTTRLPFRFSCRPELNSYTLNMT